jgi:hypothetical protein
MLLLAILAGAFSIGCQAEPAVRGGWAPEAAGGLARPTQSQPARHGAHGHERVADSGVSLAL